MWWVVRVVPEVPLGLLRHHKMPVDEAIAVGNTAYLDASWAENIRKMYK